MKLFYTLIYTLFLFIHQGFSQTQEPSDIGSSISISVVTPDNDENLSYSHLSKLKNRVLKIATSNSLSGTGYNSNFVMYPVFEIFNVEVVEGMQNITIVEAEISLFIKEVKNNLIFSTHTMSIRGSGRNKKEAITTILGDIPTSNNDLKDFINKGKKKILDYYESNCNKISEQAIALSKRNNFDEAMSILMSVPDEVSCKSKLNTIAVDIFKEYQNKTCKEQLLKAQSKISNEEFYQALTILSGIDPTSICYEEAKSTMKSIESKISEERKRELKIRQQQYKDDIALQKLRINAVKEVAIAYSKRNPPTYNYYNIIR